jgi:hypothetical protein
MNIGSDVGITVGDVAQKVSSFTSNLGVDYLDPESEPSNYVPSVINLKQHISKNYFINLDTSLEKWKAWLKMTKTEPSRSSFGS